MSITVGTQIGPYQVTSPLGEGGMGVVFRARDTRLQRDVAIKLLPDHFADDSDRLSRFQREAQVLASMNHPNIAQIYGLEQAGASTCIVMELVDGETLAQKIERGPIPIEQAIPIANQIIDALEAAHERNVVHRDLKPANIKLTGDGQVKVLDFGLAKALGDDDAQIALSHSPTKVSGSMAGIVLGTAAYMSPEQAKAKAVDARTDIWAFGCVLYEMLTVKQAFAGETTTEIIAKVLEREPDWQQIPSGTPQAIRLLLETLLAKDSKRRLRSIVDARPFLSARAQPEVATPPMPTHHKERHVWIVTAILAVLLLAALVPTALNLTHKQAEAPEMQFEIPVSSSFNNAALSLSPDGQRIAYTGISDGKKGIWIRPLSALTAQVVPGTENGDFPFWSPDSHYLGFVADGRLKKVNIAGGPVTTIGSDFSECETWNSDGTILCSSAARGIVRVSDSGGGSTGITTPDVKLGEIGHFRPQFLPDGRHFLYTSTSSGQTSSTFNITLYAGSLDSREKTKILDLAYGPFDEVPRYVSPGYLLYTRSGNLMSQPFDAKSLKVAGEPVAVAEHAGTLAASDKALVFWKVSPTPLATSQKQLTWFDRKGNSVGKVAAPAMYYGDVEISPDGHKAVATVTGANQTSSDLWAIDLDRGVPSRFTFDATINNGPAWAPDGSRIVFSSSRAGGVVPNKIFEKVVNGAGTENLVYAFSSPDDALYVEDWSRNGQYVLFEKTHLSNLTMDLWYLPLSGDKKPTAYLESPFNKVQAKLSPDGQLVAYATNESGMYQVVVYTFPDPREKWQVTANGGVEPRWRKDGRELYYLGLDGKLMAVPILSTSPFSPGEPIALLQTPLTLPNLPFPTRYDVSADGKRFLMSVPVKPASAEAANDPTPPLVVVLNWTNLLKKK
jgi:serine/threonine protein kinase